MKRAKKIPRERFEHVLQRQWTPVELVGDALPDFARAIPSEVRHRVLASGEANNSTVYSSDRIPSGTLIGGIDVYRNSPDDPVTLNKDWYAVVTSPGDARILLVDGPIHDDEHWLDEIPKRFDGVEIFGVQKKPAE